MCPLPPLTPPTITPPTIPRRLSPPLLPQQNRNISRLHASPPPPNQSAIGKIIGPGGATIRSLIEEFKARVRRGMGLGGG